MKIIVVFSGGGVMGMMSISAWAEVERVLGRGIIKIADLVVGTSIGAITSGILSTGKMDAKTLCGLYSDIMPKTFKKKLFRFYPKYSRRYINKAIDKYVGSDFKLKYCPVKSIITTVKAEDKSNHYIKSWQNKDGEMSLKEAITRSYSAPLYFGKTARKDGTWLDGGTGSNNTPIITGIWEAMRRGWLGNEKVHILSIGTGYTPEIMTHRRAEKMRWFKEIKMFFDLDDGGLARYQSMYDNIKAGESLEGKVKGFSFQHVDIKLPKKMNKIDGIKYMWKYYELGKEMSKQIDYKPLEEKCT